MTTLVLRRAVAQLPLLAAVLAVVTIGATLLGVCALLVTTTQDRALEQGLARAAPAAVDVTAFVGGVPAGEAGSVAVATRAVAGGALAPLPTTTSARVSSAMRALGPQREGDRRLAYLSGVDGLSARGRLIAGRWPVRGAAVTEAAVLEPTARVLGLAVPLSGLAQAALTHRPAVRDAGLAASPGVTVAQVVAVVTGALLLAAVLVLRPPVPARSGVDVLLAGLAAVGWWQLAAQPATGTGPDAVRILAPVLVLVAGAALVLRLVAVPLALAERLARRSRSLVLPLAAFEAARRPRVVAASLLLTLAAAAGTFGLAFGATWERSQQDQADVRVGTDLALTLVAPAVAGQVASVVAATGGVVSPVTDRTAVVGEVVGGAVPRLIAVDTTRAGALLRGRLPAGSHWDRVGAALAPAAAVTGIAVPAGDPALTLTGTLAPGTRVTPRLVLQDRAGVRAPCAAGTVPLDGRPHRLRLCEALGPGLRLVAVDLRVEQEPGAAQLSGAGRLSVALSVPGAAGADPWAATSVGIDPGQLTTPSAAVSRGPAAVVRTSATVALSGLTFEPVEVVSTAFRPPGPVPVAVSGRLATTLGCRPATGSRSPSAARRSRWWWPRSRPRSRPCRTGRRCWPMWTCCRGR